MNHERGNDCTDRNHRCDVSVVSWSDVSEKTLCVSGQKAHCMHTSSYGEDRAEGGVSIEARKQTRACATFEPVDLAFVVCHGGPGSGNQLTVATEWCSDGVQVTSDRLI